MKTRTRRARTLNGREILVDSELRTVDSVAEPRGLGHWFLGMRLRSLVKLQNGICRERSVADQQNYEARESD